jgi:DNA-binding NtrC family response regulator
MTRRILVIEDDAPLRAFVRTVLSGEGHGVDEAPDGETGLAKLAALPYDLVITDMRMPGKSGLEVLREGRNVSPTTAWVVMTAHGSVDNAVEAMKAGAADYLTKPFRSPDELRGVVARVLREGASGEETSGEGLSGRLPPEELIFAGEGMDRVRELVRQVAGTPATVLLQGESGTGKEVMARYIHETSPRRTAPYVAVNCAALAESLLESELFGHEKGAFTGAAATRKGRFESADSGTLFLDEMGEIGASVQVKLLRVIQEREVERVGGNEPIPIDVRLVAATNRDLRSSVDDGTFRRDLFYRLNVFPIRLPSLSARPGAIVPMAGHFSRRAAAAFGKAPPSISPAATAALLGHRWPGNIRELQNVIERAVIVSSGVIDPAHLDLEAIAGESQAGGILRAQERETIARILREEGGNRRRTAERLGISLRTLQYRIREFGL